MKRMIPLFVFGFILVYSVAYFKFLHLDAREAFAPGTESMVMNDREKNVYNFLQKKLTEDKGGIYWGLRAGKPVKEITSQSVGLMMQYALLKEQPGLFRIQYDILRSRLIDKDYNVRWKWAKDLPNTGIPGDDIRIAGALMEAYEVWGGKEYMDMAGFIQQQIFKRGVQEGCLHDAGDWQRQKAALPKVTLAGLDIYNMYRLTTFNREWEETADNSLRILEGSQWKTGPLYAKYFDYTKNLYVPDEEYEGHQRCNLRSSLYAAMNLAAVNRGPDSLAEWLKEQAREGAVYEWYNPGTLEPAEQVQSPGVYAMGCILARKMADDALFELMKEKMLAMQVNDPKSPYYGGFGNSTTGDFCAEDNLLALIALSYDMNP